MYDMRNGRKEQKQHIQVFVRIRPPNTSENGGKSFTIVEVPSNKEVIIHERPQDKYSKKFSFDRVFGPYAKQIEVYNTVAKPLIQEVLAGYNCTVFAYGQTGTGKTFTMEGVSDDPSRHWQTDTNAGLIPRALSHLFDELCASRVQESIVRVSFLEIYNEELFDLLSSKDDVSKIRLYEDSTKKGSVIIHGLEEVTVRNKEEVYKILEKGSDKRQTAATLMNANSSRSHTVFSITVHIKENTLDGEELLKIGKINLVDLAGSENVARSGSIEKRAREAGNINQSLLTLGRVITALVERAPHIPYRESKLTRLLQESLGGRTKTSIIATVSPANINLEETLSTLDYAHRAKNITNRPEINQKLFKKALLQEYTEEIERLKKDLLATREKVGVYLAQENYDEMQHLIEHQSKEIEEKVNHINALQETKDKREALFIELETKHSAQLTDLKCTKNQLETVTHALKSTKSRLQETEQERDEQKYLVEKHATTESTLLSQAKALLEVVNVATADVSRLHEKVSRKKQVEATNENLGISFKTHVANQIDQIRTDTSTGLSSVVNFNNLIKDDISTEQTSYRKTVNESMESISKVLIESSKEDLQRLEKCIEIGKLECQKQLAATLTNTTKLTDSEKQRLNSVLLKSVPAIHALMQKKMEEHLRQANEKLSEKCTKLASFVTEAISSMQDHHLHERDRIIRDIEEVKNIVEHVSERKRIVRDKQNELAKVLNNTVHRFNELSVVNENNYASACNTLSDMNNICDVVCEQAKDTCTTDIQKDSSLLDRVLDDVENTRSDVADDLDKCCALAVENIECGHRIAGELETNITKVRENIENYSASLGTNFAKLQNTLEDEKNEAKMRVADMQSMIHQSDTRHSEYLTKYQEESLKQFEALTTELENKNTHVANATEEIISNYGEVQNAIDRFFTDELHRDMPTGCTPTKTNYEYPRELPVTSPAERILRRFREAKKTEDHNQDFLLLNGNT